MKRSNRPKLTGNLFQSDGAYKFECTETSFFRKSSSGCLRLCCKWIHVLFQVFRIVKIIICTNKLYLICIVFLFVFRFSIIKNWSKCILFHNGWHTVFTCIDKALYSNFLNFDYSFGEACVINYSSPHSFSISLLSLFLCLSCVNILPPERARCHSQHIQSGQRQINKLGTYRLHFICHFHFLTHHSPAFLVVYHSIKRHYLPVCLGNFAHLSCPVWLNL